MRHLAFSIGIATAMLASCTIQEEFRTPVREDVKFYATFEQPEEAGTKVYANQDLHLRWDADDRVSIFNKNTYNQQYRFLGETGANSGEFEKVEGAEFVTGNDIEHVVSFYPYSSQTRINESEGITYTFPEEQFYRASSFGKGASPMVSVSVDNVLQYKNVGGFLSFSFYGEGAVNSILLEGNLGELLGGEVYVRMPLDGEPYVVWNSGPSIPAFTSLVLTCERPVVLGDTEATAKDFWFVLPPTIFRQGFTITVNTSVGQFTRKTTKDITIERNRISRMAPMKLEAETNPVIEFEDPAVKAVCVQEWDTNFDGELSYEEAAAVTDIGTVFKSNKNIVKFNELQYFTGLTEIPGQAFNVCSNLTSVVLPESVTVIGNSAFLHCEALASINLPGGLTTIGMSAFGNCFVLSDVTFPETLTAIGSNAFAQCYAFTSLEIPASLIEIGETAFNLIPGLRSIHVDEANPVYDSRGGCNAIIVTETNDLFRACSETVIPNTVTSIHQYAYSGVTGLTSIEVPSWITSIGDSAFGECSDLTAATIPAGVTSIGLNIFRMCNRLTSIVVDPANPVYDSRDICNAVIVTETNTLHATCPATVIPETVTAIGREAYSDCDYPEGDFVVPDNVTSVGQVAFAGCKNLETVILPTGLEEIGVLAFSFCPKLTSVTCLAPEPPTLVLGQFIWAFESNASDFKIYVPAESLEAYQKADGWSRHTEVIFPIE